MKHLPPKEITESFTTTNMRTKYLITLLIFSSNSVFGQIPTKAIALEDEGFNNYFLNEHNIPKVKGKITNLSKEDISKTKINYSIVTPFEKFQEEKHCALNTDGSFELKLDYAFPYQQIWISVDSLFYTGVYANTDLFIELDAAMLKTQNEAAYNGPGVKYLGYDGALNDYINNQRLFKQEEKITIYNQIQNNLRLASANYDNFIKAYDSLHLALNNLDHEYDKQNPTAFSWLSKNESESKYLGDLCVVHWGKEMPPALFEKVKSHKPYLTSNDGMLFYRYFFTYLNRVILRKRAASKLPYEEIGTSVQLIGLLDSLFAPSKSDLFKIQFSSKDPGEQKQKLEAVLPYVKTTWCKNVIKNEYNKTVEKLASINKILSESKPIISTNQLGQPIAELSFGARLYKIDGIEADSLLSLIKKSFTNKALFIDFWATWCAPCISEFPHSKKLKNESKDLPIEFVYLCTSDGSNLEKWKSKIVEYELSGTHFFVEKSLENALMNLFSASGYPSYILINTKGEYKPGLITRPSELSKDKLSALIRQ